MAEFDPPQIAKEGYHPNTQGALVELHRLVCIFLASRSFADLRQGPVDQADVLDPLQEPEEEEITRILLSVAITARVIDDREEKIFELVAGQCGTLEEGGAGKLLALREACNKIIHATKIRFDVAANEKGQRYLNPTMYLYGQRQNGAPWKASLDIIEFAKQYVGVVRHL
jgi:hypothetical protein